MTFLTWYIQGQPDDDSPDQVDQSWDEVDQDVDEDDGVDVGEGEQPKRANLFEWSNVKK